MAIRTRGKRLVIDFRCYLPDGRMVRCVESTGLIDTKENRKRVKAKWRAIKYELDQDRFNYLHFFPYGSKAKYFRDANQVMTLADYWDRWMSERTIRINTKKNYRAAEKYVIPYLGHYSLGDIDDSAVMAFRQTLIKKKLKESTINRYVSILCMVLHRAHKKGLIRDYPCMDIRDLIESQSKIDPFSFDELAAWLDFLEPNYPEWYDLILIWSSIGVRPGELYAVKWNRLDYYNKQLLIDQTRYGAADHPVKTATSNRAVDLMPDVIAAFKRQEARTRLQDGHIFLNRLGRPITNNYMIDKFRFLLSLAGLRYRPPAQMRHTFATLTIGAGENISWVSRTLGHANVQITLRKYNRFIPNLTHTDGSAYDRILSERRGRNGNNLVTIESKDLK